MQVASQTTPSSPISPKNHTGRRATGIGRPGDLDESIGMAASPVNIWHGIPLECAFIPRPGLRPGRRSAVVRYDRLLIIDRGHCTGVRVICRRRTVRHSGPARVVAPGTYSFSRDLAPLRHQQNPVSLSRIGVTPVHEI